LGVSEPAPGQAEQKSRLRAALVACGLVVSLLVVGWVAAIEIEAATLRTTAWRVFPLKTQGLVFQRAAAHSHGVLPLYGSSELIDGGADKAGYFFRTAPTGFRISPVGSVGTTSLAILQKIGGLGRDLRGKKVVISISPGWFLYKKVPTDWYKGNFSLQALSALVFGNSLDLDLRHRIAVRTLQFPEPLKASPLLQFALERLAADRPSDRMIFYALWPLGKLQNLVFDLQDHFEAMVYLSEEKEVSPKSARTRLDWQRLMNQVNLRRIAAQKKRKETNQSVTGTGARRKNERLFLQTVETAPEWGDLELLLRTLARIQARPLLMSMPIDGRYYDQTGVSLADREVYYRKIRKIAERHHFPLVEFERDDNDPLFLDHSHAHMTDEGWIHYNRVLNDFYYDRIPKS
jgi:D-alanine transfer protein